MEDHPLQNSWTAWAHKKEGNYGAAMTKVATFNTVEGFWRFMNFTPSPSEMFQTEINVPKFTKEYEGISIFKTGIRPEWEDPKNLNGGELNVRKSMNPTQLDQYWEELLMSVIGETLDPTDVITGVRIVDKSAKGKVIYRLEIWFDANQERDPQVIDAIRENLAQTFGPNLKFEYRPHGDAAAANANAGHEAQAQGHAGSGRGFHRRN
jgi:translation initiation factor 4E